MIHSAFEIGLSNHAALRVVVPADLLEAGEVVFHDRLAFAIVVEGEGSSLRRSGIEGQLSWRTAERH